MVNCLYEFSKCNFDLDKEKQHWNIEFGEKTE